MRLNPKSQSSATRNAKALVAAAADLRQVIAGLECAAALYKRGEWDAAAQDFKATMGYANMPLRLLRSIK